MFGCVIGGLLTTDIQTFGNQFEVDGILRGDLDVQTVACSDGACAIHVPAPGFALVFLEDDNDVADKDAATKTFATTAQTKTLNTATVDPSVLATANGMNGSERGWLGSTSHGSVTDEAVRRLDGGSLVCLTVAVAGILMLYFGV